MTGNDWDDDADYASAVGCTWTLVVVSVLCVLLVVGVIFAVCAGFIGLRGVLAIIGG
ncbi:hypothetical protein [Streptomyces sp. 769]|uniref:hypothetical protein n=1 Tax=Streptomyces sp. 769 TaxID=1262452 RepID=UPI000A4178B4|nr:hypothetical protein [Streptomyces sp. 769]